MKPYTNKRLTGTYSDVVDIHEEGRKTSIGGRPGHGYIRNKKAKAATRRYLKRADKQSQAKND